MVVVQELTQPPTSPKPPVNGCAHPHTHPPPPRPPPYLVRVDAAVGQQRKRAPLHPERLEQLPRLLHSQRL